MLPNPVAELVAKCDAAHARWLAARTASIQTPTRENRAAAATAEQEFEDLCAAVEAAESKAATQA